jgi:hypothetical protein
MSLGTLRPSPKYFYKPVIQKQKSFNRYRFRERVQLLVQLGQLGIGKGFCSVLLQAGDFGLADRLDLGLEGLGLGGGQLPQLRFPLDLNVLFPKTDIQFVHGRPLDVDVDGGGLGCGEGQTGGHGQNQDGHQVFHQDLLLGPLSGKYFMQNIRPVKISLINIKMIQAGYLAKAEF